MWERSTSLRIVEQLHHRNELVSDHMPHVDNLWRGQVTVLLVAIHAGQYHLRCEHIFLDYTHLRRDRRHGGWSRGGILEWGRSLQPGTRCHCRIWMKAYGFFCAVLVFPHAHDGRPYQPPIQFRSSRSWRPQADTDESCHYRVEGDRST